MVDKLLSNRAFAAKVMPDIWKILKGGQTSPFFKNFLGGPFVRRFEKEFARYVGAKYAVSMANGTLALSAAYTALFCETPNTQPEAIVSPYTFVATVSELVRSGYQIVFADVETNSACINPESIRDLINDKTGLIVPMYPLGSHPDLSSIMDIDPRVHGTYTDKDYPHGIPVVEDACLPPNELVCTLNGWRPIATVEAGEYVLSHDGNYHIVSETTVRQFDGYVLRITPWSLRLPITLTPEHLVLAVKKYTGKGRWAIRPTFTDWDAYGKAKQHYSLGASWRPAQELEIGDFLLFPMSLESVELQQVSVPSTNPSYEHKMPDTIRLSTIFLYTIGMYVSEGCAFSNGIVISNADHDKLEKCRSGLREAFGIEGKIKAGKGAYNLWIYSKGLRDIFRSWFGERAATKRLPTWLTTLSPYLVGPLVRGLWDGDGSDYRHRGRRVFSYRTTSGQLARQVFLLLLRCGIISNITTSHAYSVRIQSDLYGARLASLLGKSWSQNRGQSRSTSSFLHDNYLWTPIRNIEALKYVGNVHNLHVQNSNSYVAELTTVHNCQALAPNFKLLGRMAAFSFQQTKSLSLGEGGMVVTDWKEGYDRLCYIRNMGCKYGPFKEYYAHIMPTNYRMIEIQAAIGLHALKDYDKVVKRQLMLGKILFEGILNSDWLLPQDPWSRNGYIFAGKVQSCVDRLIYDCKSSTHSKAVEIRGRFLKKVRRWNKGVPGKVIGPGYSELVYELPAFRGYERKEHMCPVAEMWRDHAVWFDIRNWSVEEVKSIARVVEKFKP